MSDLERMQDEKCYPMLLSIDALLFVCQCNTSKTNAFLYVAQSFAQWSAAHCFHLLLRHIAVHWSVSSCVLFGFLKVSYNEDYFHSLWLPLHQAQKGLYKIVQSMQVYFLNVVSMYSGARCPQKTQIEMSFYYIPQTD